MNRDRTILIYDNYAKPELSAVMASMGKELREQGFKVVFLNHNAYSPECFRANAWAVAICGGGAKSGEVADAYNLAGIPALIFKGLSRQMTAKGFLEMIEGPKKPREPEPAIEAQAAQPVKKPRRQSRKKGK